MPVELPPVQKVRVLTAGGAASMSSTGHGINGISNKYNFAKAPSRTGTTTNNNTAAASPNDVKNSSPPLAGSGSSSGSEASSSTPTKMENRPNDDSFALDRRYRDNHHDEDDDNTYNQEDDPHHQEIHSLLQNDKQAEQQRHLDDLYNPEDPEGDVDGYDGHGGVDGHGDKQANDESLTSNGKFVWLFICFFGIMLSFVGYGLLLEYATSGGRKLHELSFLFVTSALYTFTAAAGRNVRGEEVTTIPPARFAVLGITSMGSTFCSVRSLR